MIKFDANRYGRLLERALYSLQNMSKHLSSINMARINFINTLATKYKHKATVVTHGEISLNILGVYLPSSKTDCPELYQDFNNKIKKFSLFKYKLYDTITCY